MFIYFVIFIHVHLLNVVLSQIGEFQQPVNQNPYYVEQREREREQYEQQQQQQFLNNLNKQNMFYQYYFNRPTYNVSVLRHDPPSCCWTLAFSFYLIYILPFKVEVNTVYGRVRGTTYQVASPALYQSFLYVSNFLGIPYAAPPTGENRFQLPREPDVRYNALYDATYFRSSCYQDRAGEIFIRQHIPDFPATNFSEDCLYLNIFAPNVCFFILIPTPLNY